MGREEKGRGNKKLTCDFESDRKPMKPAGQMLLSLIYKEDPEAQSQWLFKGHILSGRHKIQDQVTWFQDEDETREGALKHGYTPYVLHFIL